MIQTTPDKRTQAEISRDKQTQVKLALDKLVQGVVKTSLQYIGKMGRRKVTTQTIPMNDEVIQLALDGALFVVNHSGGKDSQAMLALIRREIPADQLVVVHASLGRIEWAGTIEKVNETSEGLPVLMATTANGKDLLERIEERGQFPDPARRWCTSDFKRGPIEREIRHYLKTDAGKRFNGVVVNCMGLRAEESASRSKATTWKRNARNSKAGRAWYDWLPIHHLLETEVFAVIADAGQKPHWAYGQGMTRLSCSFCIMACKADLKTAARLRPDLYQEYQDLEKRINHTLSPSRVPLREIVEGKPKTDLAQAAIERRRIHDEQMLICRDCEKSHQRQKGLQYGGDESTCLPCAIAQSVSGTGIGDMVRDEWERVKDL